MAVTPGTWKVRRRYDVYAAVGTYIGTTRANNPEEMPENFRAIDEANATLIADAGTTYNACDMLPSELLTQVTKLRAERNELVWALEDLRKYVKRAPFGTLTEADRALAKHKPEYP